MLENKMTQDTDAIEVLFCEPFSRLESRPMTENESRLMMKLLIAEKNPQQLKESTEEDLKQEPFQLQILRGSIKNRFTVELSEPATLFVSLIISSAGEAIMYLTYIQYKAKKENIRRVTLESLCHWFPIGFPTQDSLRDIWDSQKVKRPDDFTSGSDNLLDYPKAGVSIQFLDQES
jgi:hypothetical protein